MFPSETLRLPVVNFILSNIAEKLYTAVILVVVASSTVVVFR
jgi:hypothetical protein